MEVCTIIAKNYLAHARVLARSLAAHNPQARLWTLIIDEHARYVDPAEEPFEVLTPAEVGCDGFDHMAMRYTVLELSTAVKPWLLRHLLERTGGPVTYLDPDIEVFASLEALDRAAAEHGVALIPHNDKPLPIDGRRPSQVDIMIAGVYNLGYVSVGRRDEVDRLLDWWADRLLRDCRVDPVWGYFVDQRWFDLAPGFLSDVAIIREPQFNVAYWNLHCRTLSRGRDGYRVDGRPLAFFHYSGFDPDRPDVLSRHQDRIIVAEDPALGELLRHYAEELQAAGHRVSRGWPYSFHALADGTELDDELRADFDRYAIAHDDRVPSPFTLEGARAFEMWRREHPVGPDEPPPARRERGGPQLPWGVNLIADFQSGGSGGQVARQLLAALDHGAAPALPLQVTGAHPGVDRIDFWAAPIERATFAVNVIVADPTELPELAGHAGASLFSGRHSIALCAVTHDRLPAPGVLSLADELWAPSAHVAGLLECISDVPVHQVTLPVLPRELRPVSRAQLRLPESRFVFLVLVDHQESLEAQNPFACLDVFAAEFEGAGDVALVIACRNESSDREGHARLEERATAVPGVTLLSPHTAERRSALIAASNCVVSLHREVAFGLPLAEAMWRGIPVIATRYSGNLEFMSDTDSLLVDCELVPAEAGRGPRTHLGSFSWAEPDLDHARARMRALHQDRDAGAQLARSAARAVRERHSLWASHASMEAQLARIAANWHPRRPLRAAEVPQPISEISRRLDNGPVARPNSTGGAARESLRRGVLRVMQPYTAYQEGLNRQVAAALEDLAGRLERQGSELAGERAVREALERRLRTTIEGGRMEGPGRSDELKELLMEYAIPGVEHLKRLLTQDTDRTVYLALSELAHRHREIGEGPGEPPAQRELTGYELRVFSQNGEDGVIAEILRRIGAPARVFVEFGVESGREGNCVYLADVAGWEGLFLEGDGGFFSQLESKYAAQPRVQTVNTMVSPENVEELFERAGVPPEPDVVSIDVDGTDYWIWEALERFRPRVLVIEYNSALDPRRRLVQPRDVGSWDGSSYFGASLGALVSLGEAKDYRLVHTDRSGANAFFVRGDLVADNFPQGDEVVQRGFPNYFGKGYQHPPAAPGRRYLDLDLGDLVTPDPFDPAAASPASSS